MEAVNCSSGSSLGTGQTQTADQQDDNNEQRRRAKVTAAVAVKFLLARKFDVPRALVLYEQYEESRRDGLYDFDPRSEKLKRELETGKFTILVSQSTIHNSSRSLMANDLLLSSLSIFQPERDETGAAIALFTANRHFPLTVEHQTTLQGIVFQLDVAIEHLETQKAGLVFIYDMSGSKYSNFDYELSKKILTLLKVKPERVLDDDLVLMVADE